MTLGVRSTGRWVVLRSTHPAVLVLEHRLVQPDRLDQINIAFFHLNSVISVLLFLAVLTDTWLA